MKVLLFVLLVCWLMRVFNCLLSCMCIVCVLSIFIGIVGRCMIWCFGIIVC